MVATRSRRSKSPARTSPVRKSPPARAKSPAKASPARSAPASSKSSSATYQLTLIYLACFLDYFAVALAGCLFESTLSTYDVRGRLRQIVNLVLFVFA